MQAISAAKIDALTIAGAVSGSDDSVAFGGAGPMHACGLAEEMGIADVLVETAGGGSAFRPSFARK